MPSSIRDEPNLRGCPEFGGKYRPAPDMAPPFEDVDAAVEKNK